MNNIIPLSLHELHQSLGARFTHVNGAEVVLDYGDPQAEHSALRASAGIFDLSFRSRLCLTGADRVRFLHGQVTNDVKKLGVGEGCYAALVTAKGKMVGDLNIFALQDEMLLDFEPGLTQTVTERLEKYIVADDVQVVNVAPYYGLLSVQGPNAESVVRALGLFGAVPVKEFDSVNISDTTQGEIYLMNHPRLAGSEGFLSSRSCDTMDRRDGAVPGTTGFDLFVPTNSVGAVADKVIAAAKSFGGRLCGWTAFETARIESGIPRFGVDMDETNIPLECGIEARAVSYNKGCYIGQEIINRIHSIGHVNRELVGLRIADNAKALPVTGDKLFQMGKQVGHVTSAVDSPTLKAILVLGYVRREASAIGTELVLRTPRWESSAKLEKLPFAK